MIPSPLPGLLPELDAKTAKAPQQAADPSSKRAVWQREMERAFSAWFHHPATPDAQQHAYPEFLAAGSSARHAIPRSMAAVNGDSARREVQSAGWNDSVRQAPSTIGTAAGKRTLGGDGGSQRRETADTSSAFIDDSEEGAVTTMRLSSPGLTALSTDPGRPATPVAGTEHPLSARLAEHIAHLLSQPVIEPGSPAETLPMRLQPTPAPTFSFAAFPPALAVLPEDVTSDALPTPSGTPRMPEKSTPPAVQPPVRMHAEWIDNGVRLWLGANAQASAEISRISQLLVDWLRVHGAQLLSLVCNGRSVYAVNEMVIGGSDSDGSLDSVYSTATGLPAKRIAAGTLRLRLATAYCGTGPAAQDFFTYLHHQET